MPKLLTMLYFLIRVVNTQPFCLIIVFKTANISWWLRYGNGSASNSGDTGSTPWSGRSSGGGGDCPLQYSCIRNPTEDPGGLYSAWSHEESDMTERLTLTLKHDN